MFLLHFDLQCYCICAGNRMLQGRPRDTGQREPGPSWWKRRSTLRCEGQFSTAAADIQPSELSAVIPEAASEPGLVSETARKNAGRRSPGRAHVCQAVGSPAGRTRVGLGDHGSFPRKLFLTVDCWWFTRDLVIQDAALSFPTCCAPAVLTTGFVSLLPSCHTRKQSPAGGAVC